MQTSESVTLLIALVSLVISIFSMLYARRAFQFEIHKFNFEQFSKNVFIELKKTVIGELKCNFVLVTDFRIINRKPETVFVRSFVTSLYFNEFKGLLKRNMRVDLPPDKGIYAGKFFSMDTSRLVKSHGGIRAVVIDLNSKRRLIFDRDKMVAIEPSPSSYAWRAITVIPRPVFEELETHHRLEKLELTITIHPGEHIVCSSSSFAFYGIPKHSGDLKLTELAELFPDHKFEW